MEVPVALPKRGNKKKTRVKRGGSDSQSKTPSASTAVFCTAVGNNDRTVDIGLVLVFLVMIVYCFGLVQSIRSLPDINPNIVPSLFRHLTGNEDGPHTPMLEKVGAASAVQRNEGQGEPEKAAVEKVLSNPAPANLRGAAAKANADKLGGVVVPEAKWPVSVRDEDNNFETIFHPGDEKTTMSVPKFWSDPVHNNKLMSRDLAMKIGSCVTPDANGNHARGDSCPLSERTIFVGIASYRDWQCRYTMESIFARAKYPERVRVGVVDQIVDGEDFVCDSPIKPCDEDPEQALCKYSRQVDVYEMEAQLAVGPVFARHIGYRLHRGEYYAMQSDAHVTYTQDWDVDIIEQHESTKNEMAVLSTYLTDVVGSIDEKTGKSLRKTRPIMCNTDYEGGHQGQHLRHGSQPERLPAIHGSPQLQPYWAAGYSFSRGHFIVNVPYDLYQPMIFQGEEMSIGLRGFTIGYDYYAPERSVCFHHYAKGPNAAKRNKVKHFWENASLYKGTGVKAMKRLLGIVGMNPEVDPSEWNHAEEEKYGIGKARSTQKFYDTFGIDVVNKKTEHNLCQFVHAGGRMHKEFTKFLRSDGMGIDYSKITYRFKDPEIVDY